ncbi:hypothetical protein EV44_g3241 [Erysiphe necator]|uniref:Retrotransposon gag domain-containing protein n=1 Tax=Uncinula necator TaxID=52586 RepID=A0A0B1P575_UNCNE|nr:hypothetical protein EV44_g3241 [Erysiphe necator]
MTSDQKIDTNQLSTSTNSLALKFDRLPILTGSENYRRWAGSWEIASDAMGLLEVLTGEMPKPEQSSENFKIWKNANKQLRGAILNAVDETLQTVVIDHQTAKEAWDQFKSRYDRETSNSTIDLLKSITNLSLKDGDDISDYLTLFNDSWNRLRNQSSSAKTPLAKAFQDLTSSEDAKGAFLLSSLPKSMKNVVDNPVTKELVSYGDVSAKLLDVSVNRKSSSTDDKAYNANKLEKKECSWCKARKYRFEGHLDTEYRKLKASQQKKKENKVANAAQASKSDNSDLMKNF